jgi:hypothetical protein
MPDDTFACSRPSCGPIQTSDLPTSQEHLSNESLLFSSPSANSHHPSSREHCPSEQTRFFVSRIHPSHFRKMSGIESQITEKFARRIRTVLGFSWSFPSRFRGQGPLSALLLRRPPFRFFSICRLIIPHFLAHDVTHTQSGGIVMDLFAHLFE